MVSLKDNLSDSQEIVQGTLNQLSQLRKNLQKIDAALHNTLTAQEKVYNIIEEYKDQHQDLANQWQNSLLEAKQNLQMLLNISQSEIQLLAKTASDARESL
ncbi:14844_t:CDS:2 [Racocetra fulgida]|uniref:14844_t:CDS:1 n=1 Tax=Racocetra fulgida TaxID=60492 RepID=A0A9N8Z1M0_9GLOM|nr:14844_t:CDS:2 [Racocetra fulgida]